MLIYLLPPSEAKQSGGQSHAQSTIFDSVLPYDIAIGATPKDLKCKDKRYAEGISLNENIYTSPTLPAIQRYTGVMYKHIYYSSLDQDAQDYFDQHILICSGMYGLVSPTDTIPNYKLPIDTKGLYAHRTQQHITAKLISHIRSLLDTQSTPKEHITILDLLPQSYKKMIDRTQLDQAQIAYIPVNFYKQDKDTETHRIKYTHGVKSVKGARLHRQCTNKAHTIQEIEGIHMDGEIAVIV